jgi:hypothetical protein
MKLDASTLLALLAFGAGLSACTLITSANDYEVDPALEGGQEPDASKTRDLQFEFIGMYPHAEMPLDVAVVNENQVLQARARMVLPPITADVSKYPTIELDLHNGLPPGAHSLYFYADSDGDGMVDLKDNGPGKAPGIIEHIWIVDLDPDGIGEFTHVVDFQPFTEDDYSSLNGDLVMQLPMLQSASVDVRECIEDKIGGDVEIKLTLKSVDRQVGLFRRSADTPLPEDGIRLRGILDGGSIYRIDVVVDGATKKTFEKTAPPTGNLEVPPGEWLPVRIQSALDCQ